MVQQAVFLFFFFFSFFDKPLKCSIDALWPATPQRDSVLCVLVQTGPKPTVTWIRRCSRRSLITACNRMSLGVACSKLPQIVLTVSHVEHPSDCNASHWIGQINQVGKGDHLIVCDFSVKCLNAKIALNRRVLGISLTSCANDFDHSDYPCFVHVSLSSCSVTSGQTTTKIHTQTSPVLQCCVWLEWWADVLLL